MRFETRACRLLCVHAGQQVLSVEYRLAPEHPFPAAVEDAVAAFRWAQENASALGADPGRVAVGGDSAGANLAAVVAQATAAERPPLAQLLVYPTTDRESAGRSAELFGEGYFLTAGFDLLRDEGEAYARALCAAGTPCVLHREPSMAHGFVQLTGASRGAHRATVELARRWRTLLSTRRKP